MLGTWLTDDGASKVVVTAAKAAEGSSVYAGKVVWLKERAARRQACRDANNADAATREATWACRSCRLQGFRRWLERLGAVLHQRRHELPGGRLSIGADGRLQLKVDAGLVSKTDYWTG